MEISLCEKTGAGSLDDERFVGIPYRLGGSDFDGADCAGLVVLYLEERNKSLQLPSYGTREEAEALLDGEVRRQLKPVKIPERGDVVAFMHNGEMETIGVYVGYGKALVARHGRTSAIYRISRFPHDRLEFYRG